jgi:hypothetical protein
LITAVGMSVTSVLPPVAVWTRRMIVDGPAPRFIKIEAQGIGDEFVLSRPLRPKTARVSTDGSGF